MNENIETFSYSVRTSLERKISRDNLSRDAWLLKIVTMFGGEISVTEEAQFFQCSRGYLEILGKNPFQFRIVLLPLSYEMLSQ